MENILYAIFKLTDGRILLKGDFCEKIATHQTKLNNLKIIKNSSSIFKTDKDNTKWRLNFDYNLYPFSGDEEDEFFLYSSDIIMDNDKLYKFNSDEDAILAYEVL